MNTEFRISAKEFKEARNYADRNIKWKFGKIIRKEEAVIYKILMDNGVIWRRHVNEILRTKSKGGN